MAQPKGEMVGRHYVNPHWSENLAPIVQQIAGLYGEKKVGEQEAVLNKAMQAQSDQWMASRPQATQFEVQGPPMEGQGQPMSAPVEPTQQERLAWAQQGQKNPLTRALAAKYGEDILIKEPERDEARAFRAAESAKAQAATAQIRHDQLAQQAKELDFRMNQANTTNEQKMEIAKMLDNTKRELGFAGLEVQRSLAELRASTARNAAEAKTAVAGNKPGKPVPNAIMKTMQGAEGAAEGLKTVSESFKPEYGGVTGAIDRISGTWNPFSGKQSEEAANWWKNNELQASLVERHEKFGTALSAGERSAWAAATIEPGMKPDIIKKNLDTRARIAKDFYKKIRDQYVTAGYPQVKDAFQVPEDEKEEGLPPGVTVTPRKK